jgi:hypothetical protein
VDLDIENNQSIQGDCKMTDQWGFPSDDANGFDQGNASDNKGLRSWAENVNKQNKELQGQLAQMQAELRKQQAVNTFEDLGLPRSAASLYTGELNSEAIGAWANQVRSAFGMQQGNAPADQSTPAPPALDAQTQANLQTFTQSGNGAPPSTSMDDWMRQQNQAGSIQDLIENAKNWR